MPASVSGLIARCLRIVSCAICAAPLACEVLARYATALVAQRLDPVKICASDPAQLKLACTASGRPQPHRRADQVADVVDKEQRLRAIRLRQRAGRVVGMSTPGRPKGEYRNAQHGCVMIMQVDLREGRAHHPGIKVAPAPGVDLDRRRSGGAYAVGIQAGLLIAFYHRHRHGRGAAFEGLDGGAQQRGLARAGRDGVDPDDGALDAAACAGVPVVMRALPDPLLRASTVDSSLDSPTEAQVLWQNA